MMKRSSRCCIIACGLTQRLLAFQAPRPGIKSIEQHLAESWFIYLFIYLHSVTFVHVEKSR